MVRRAVKRPFNCGWLSIRISHCHRRGHGPFRGRVPHDDVRVGRLNVSNEMQMDCCQPFDRGRRNHRPGGGHHEFRKGARDWDRVRICYAIFSLPHSKLVPSTQMQ